MHYPESELRRIPLLSTPVNRGKEKGRGPVGPRPRTRLKELALQMPPVDQEARRSSTPPTNRVNFVSGLSPSLES
jgi:hypothetical protein